MADETQVTLESLGSGAAAEMFNEELSKVLGNILDINTDAKTSREVTLKVTIKPNEDRELGSVVLSATSKLAPVKSVGTVFFIGRRAGQPIATERNPKQLAFEDTNVASIGGGK